ncbi:hypothetical protein IU487_34820 [Nocardia puris]|nr:hypothetical protein [Nocardia puris]
MGWCREMDDQEGYVAFRQLLIEHPVLDGDEFLDKRGLPALAALSDYIQQSYEHPGAHLVHDKMFQQCGRCANLSVPTVHGWRCVEDLGWNHTSTPLGEHPIRRRHHVADATAPGSTRRGVRPGHTHRGGADSRYVERMIGD